MSPKIHTRLINICLLLLVQKNHKHSMCANESSKKPGNTKGIEKVLATIIGTELYFYGPWHVHD